MGWDCEQIPFLPVTSPLSPSASVSCIISMPDRFSSATSKSPCPQLLVERLAHSRSSAIPVSCMNRKVGRFRLVGPGPGVDGGESGLVYTLE